ncbi:hypothetical protein FP803_04450 [Candidatus Woesearchaeota archaeon]|nr:hypothetical protein [Candidatus Woesearchaeota archaeon]
MKRNVNFGFFLLLVATLISLAGLSLYYQTTFKDLYVDYKGRIDDLKNVSSTLGTERTKLEQTSQQLIIREEREKELSTQYTGLRTEKEKLEEEKASLQKQLAVKTSELTQKRAELATAQAELSISKTDLAAAKATISGLRADIANLDESIANLNAQLAACTCP